MIRIIKNDTSDERGDLPGCELAGKMWKYGFPESRAVVFLEKFCPSPQPEGSKAGLWGQGVQLPGLLLPSRVSVLWELLSRWTHPNLRACLAPGKEEESSGAKCQCWALGLPKDEPCHPKGSLL